MIDHERWHDLEKSSETYRRKRPLESISLSMTSEVSQFNSHVLSHLKMALEDMVLFHVRGACLLNLIGHFSWLINYSLNTVFTPHL